ncbi:MAG: beta-galactosidase [Candidatus Hydrogenedentes bacterium]|nr:beta-galactosidase [Candidatus Hydrogenedentota bacterium]
MLGEATLQTAQRNGHWIVSVIPSGNHYEEDTLGFRINDTVVRRRRRLVVELDYVDDGYGVIAAKRLINPEFKGEWRPASRSVAYTRLNTGKLRTAAFEFDGEVSGELDSGKPDVVFTGTKSVREVRVIDGATEDYWSGLQAKIPAKITPAVTLRRPMQVVCSAGVQVLGRNDGPKSSVDMLREYAPLAKALGFNAVEAYVRWDFVEPAPGHFDWSFYDALVDELRRYDLKLFPLLIVGSAYTLPDWFYDSDENVGFVCLEHGLSNPIQSIWSPYHQKHVTRFLQEFGKHYEPMRCLQGVRLGPSGNFGESQYPAAGDWGYGGAKMHLHIGMWAGDDYAAEDFRQYLRAKYETDEALRRAWESETISFEAARPILPEHCTSKRQRIDVYTWYNDSMSNWCEWWAIEARKAMPNTPIYQSAGGWGAAEIGTDYTAQAKSMLKVNGGIRLTNELDSFHQCYYATRLGATAARLYQIPVGFEPAMGHTARGTAGRMFNCITNNGDHFFIYGGNIFDRQTSIENWLKHYGLFDGRQAPRVEVALYYPQTMNFLSQDTFRYLNAWGFNPYAREIRNQLEVDYLDDRLISDGFLSRYKVLIFAWGNQVESGVLKEIDAWLRNGGTVIFPCFLHTTLATVEGDDTVFKNWDKGDTGKGQFFHYLGDDEPPSLYAAFVRATLLGQTSPLSSQVRAALESTRPDSVFISCESDGSLLVLNFGDEQAVVAHPAFGRVEIASYSFLQVKYDVAKMHS